MYMFPEESEKEGRRGLRGFFSSGRMNLIKIDEIGSLSPAAASADEAGVPERLWISALIDSQLQGLP